MRSKQGSKGHSVTRGKSVRRVAARAAFGRNVPEFGARPDWRRIAAVGFVVSLAPFASVPAFAANCTFTPAAGNWNLAGNWSCGVIPSGPTNDNATINVGSTVTIDSAQSIDTLANAGLIDIDAFLLELQGGATTNTGTINVGAGPIPNNAALNIGGGHNVNNTGGTINVSADSVVNQFGSSITGGTINTTGTGKLVAFNSGANILSGVTLNGTLDLASAVGIERIVGGLTLNGRVDIGMGSVFAPQGNQTIGGNGVIVFADANASNRFNVEQGNLVLGSGITVSGNTGRIGAQQFDGGASTLRNDGIISADVDGGTITLQVNGLTTNNGTLAALNGGTLLLNSAVTGGAGSQVIAGAGSTVVQNGVTLAGDLTINGLGSFRASNSGSNVLSGVSFLGTLDLASQVGIERVVGGLTLDDATIRIGSGSVFAPQGNQAIGGTGTILFADSNASNRFNVEQGNLVLGSDITVRGETGRIGAQQFDGGASTLEINGTIAADVAGGTITLQVNGLTTNNGTLSALNGGTLLLNSAVTGGAGSQVIAGAGSTVVQNGVTLAGDLTINGLGSFRASNSGSNVLSGVSFLGTLDLASQVGIERVVGGLTLDDATIRIGSGSVFAPQGNQTIGGTGTILFADNNASNRFNVEQGNLVLGSGITVRGDTGRIGAQQFDGGASTLEINGTIAADVDGGTITLQVNGLTTNKGTLAAQNGGTLVISSRVNNIAGSQILAGTDSTVLQNGVTLNGTINVNGGGSFRASNSGSNVVDAVDFTGVLDLASDVGIERVVNGLTLNGRVDIGAGSVFAPEGNQTIDGVGSIVFADANASNRLNVEQGNLVLGSDITVRGHTGRIGAQQFNGGASTLRNDGTISADTAGGTFTLQVNGLTTNNGTLSALNGGTLLLNSAVTGNAGSQIIAGAGSSVVQNGVTLAGDLTINGVGSFRASNSSSNALVGVTFTGGLDLASAVGIERVVGGLTLEDATISIGNGSVFAPEGNQTIGGTGTIVFTDANGGNRLNVEQGNLTLGAGIVVRGGNGFVGQQAFNGGAASLLNQGLITADVADRGIVVDINGVFTNQGALRAENGGLLTLQSTAFDNSAGTILARDDSRVLISNASITGGVLGSEGTGRLAVTNSGSNFLQGITLNGVLDIAAAIARTSSGGMVLNGRIDISAGGVFAPEGNQTISGVGSIVFADGNGSNRLNVEQGNLIIGSGVTVRGTTGIIGQQAFNGGAASLTNNGSIVSEGAGTVSINVNGSLTNNGVLRAQNGTLALSDTLSGTGNLQVDATGVLNLANGANTQGRLALGAAGAALGIGTGNLTINTDYTNVGAGTGNAFNRRAGVTGTGLIVSGGDAAQAITGSSVAGGNTTNATLTIGNVRVGANTFNYQVANTGTTGPTLRGAIQTNVNGANISDVRLSGSGVTASNYNAGGPGANSGNLAVTFTSATAGALEPLTGQVINLRSNFEDITDQKLNIVLQGGAAAYNAAIGSAGSPVVLANQRVGGTNSATLSVLNAAAVGSFSEDLNATIGGTSSGVTATGSVLGLLAGSTNSSGISVGVNTATSGATSGTVTLDYVSTGTVNGVSNSLAPISVGSQGVSVSGNVYQLASGDLLTAPLNFVTVQVGQAVSRTLSIRNTATGAAGFVEDLNASFGAATGTGASRITGTGSINGLLAGATNSSAMVVNVDTSTAGTVNGAIAVNYVSAGAVAGASNGLGTFAVGSDSFEVDGSIETAVVVINQASPLVNTPSIDFGARRVGDAAPTAFVSVTNVASVDPQAALDAAIASNGAPVTASGSFGLLAPGATNAGSLLVGLDTSTSGNFTGGNAGSATISFVSNAANVGDCEPDCALELASQQVSVSGKVYETAQVQLGGSTTIDFGTVRVDDSATATRTLSNVAAGALVDSLTGSLSGAAAPFSTSAGTLGSGIAGNGGSTLLGFTLDTSAAGNFAGGASATLASHNDDLADIDLGGIDFVLTGTVNNLAAPALSFDGGNGSFVQNSNLLYTWDFGTVSELADILFTGNFRLTNAATGPADNLDGTWDTTGANAFQVGGFDAVDDLAAGRSIAGLQVRFDSALFGPGAFGGSVFLDPRSVFLGLDDVDLAPIELRFVGRIRPDGGVGVPAPGALALLVLAAMGLGLRRSRRAAA